MHLERRVVCAANRCGGITLVAPRHWDATMRHQYDMLEIVVEDMPGHHLFEQGFINTWGEFLTRQEAWKVAKYNNQLLRLVGSQYSELEEDAELYSENLY